jgi:hypothetical protein
MKIYTKLPIPVDTAWDVPRYKWQRYMHWRIKEFFRSLHNLIVWLPTIWKDRHWDDYYITKILQKKIELQRAYLVSANRHVNIDRDNFWMTVVLNLLERKHTQYYQMEKYDYVVLGDEVFSDYKSDTLDDYIKKYPSAERAAKKFYPNYPHFDDKDALAHFMCHIRQEQADDLIFDILKEHSAEWWD